MNFYKKKFYILLFVLTNTYIFAQECSTYHMFKKGATVEMSSFDKNGKLIATTQNTVVDLIKKSATFESELDVKGFNAKGKETFSVRSTVKCAGNGISVSMKNLMAADQMAGFKDMEIKVDETFLDYPSSIVVGQNLKAGEFKADISTGGMKLMSMNMLISDRKVVAKEEVETPVGKIDCYKITYNSTMKTVVSVNYEATEWYSTKYGVVKTESY